MLVGLVRFRVTGAPMRLAGDIERWRCRIRDGMRRVGFRFSAARRLAYAGTIIARSLPRTTSLRYDWCDLWREETRPG